MASKRDKRDSKKSGMKKARKKKSLADDPNMNELAALLGSGKVDPGRLEGYINSLKEERYQALPDVLTVTQVAKLLQVSRQTIYSLIKKGKLKGKRVGQRWRFSKAAIIKWVAGGGK